MILIDTLQSRGGVYSITGIFEYLLAIAFAMPILSRMVPSVPIKCLYHKHTCYRQANQMQS